MWRFIPKFIKEKADKILTRWEHKGFDFTNKAHKYAINICLMAIVYEIYTFLRDYNRFFLNARAVKKLEQFNENAPINEIIAQESKI